MCPALVAVTHSPLNQCDKQTLTDDYLYCLPPLQLSGSLPKPTVPRFDLMPSLFADSVILSIVCFAVSLSLAKIFAKKHNYRVDANQELVALGSANVFSSFFLAYPCSAALSRSTLQEKVGGKTQIAGLVSCAIILTVLLLLAPFLYHLPKVNPILARTSTILRRPMTPSIISYISFLSYSVPFPALFWLL